MYVYIWTHSFEWNKVSKANAGSEVVQLNFKTIHMISVLVIFFLKKYFNIITSLLPFSFLPPIPPIPILPLKGMASFALLLLLHICTHMHKCVNTAYLVHLMLFMGRWFQAEGFVDEWLIRDLIPARD